VSFKQQQSSSRFQNAPRVNFFLQSHLMTLPNLDNATVHVEAKPLLRIWNMLFMGFMVSSAFGLYAHASMNDITPGSSTDTGSLNLPSYTMALQSEPADKSRPLKPLTEKVQELAVIDELPDLIDGIKPNSAEDNVKQLLTRPEQDKTSIAPMPITGVGQLSLFEPSNGSSNSVLDNDFDPSIDESGLQPVKPLKPAKTTSPKSFKSVSKARVAEKSPYDYEPEDGEEEDADQRLLNKILAKPRLAVGMPQVLPKPHPNSDSLLGKPESRYGTHASVIETTAFLSPLRRLNISSRYGWRYGRMHSGIDLAAPTGSDILAVKGGMVVYSGWQGGYGKTIIIDHGDGRQTRYAHCHRLFATEGQRVAQGDRIALVGNTGHSTGSHLHFEVLVNGIARNPENYLFR
jgi:murein DD-endopeptidase MepM/ murein hydrolase activator NlpD